MSTSILFFLMKSLILGSAKGSIISHSSMLPMYLILGSFLRRKKNVTSKRKHFSKQKTSKISQGL